MQDVVENGTARVARMEGISVAGKTGTAENYGIINGKREKLKDHSWFVCFAPRENPKIAIAVIVENAGFGATWAGPIAALMMEKYLNDTLRTERLKEVERIAAQGDHSSRCKAKADAAGFHSPRKACPGDGR